MLCILKDLKIGQNTWKKSATPVFKPIFGCCVHELASLHLSLLLVRNIKINQTWAHKKVLKPSVKPFFAKRHSYITLIYFPILLCTWLASLSNYGAEKNYFALLNTLGKTDWACLLDFWSKAPGKIKSFGLWRTNLKSNNVEIINIYFIENWQGNEICRDGCTKNFELKRAWEYLFWTRMLSHQNWLLYLSHIARLVKQRL
jgi:hypothetical protein